MCSWIWNCCCYLNCEQYAIELKCIYKRCVLYNMCTSVITKIFREYNELNWFKYHEVAAVSTKIISNMFSDNRQIKKKLIVKKRWHCSCHYLSCVVFVVDLNVWKLFCILCNYKNSRPRLYWQKAIKWFDLKCVNFWAHCLSMRKKTFLLLNDANMLIDVC